jgi:uncharacterized protein
MPTAQSEPSASAASVPLAPRWHTAALVALMLLVAAAGTLLKASGGATAPPPATTSSRLLGIYLPLFVVQWGLVLYVSRVGRPHNALPALLGERWATPRRAALDLLLAAVGWGFLLFCEVAWARLFATTSATSVASMLPQAWPERLAWVIVASSVGFCEEVVYRGYLQTQLAAFTGRVGVAVVLQAALFGLAHAEQGAGTALRFGAYGLAFGALARWRRSLLPGIVCHAWTDLASGLLRP